MREYIQIAFSDGIDTGFQVADEYAVQRWMFQSWGITEHADPPGKIQVARALAQPAGGVWILFHSPQQHIHVLFIRLPANERLRAKFESAPN